MPNRNKKIELVFFLMMAVALTAYVQTFIRYPALSTGLVFTMPLMVAFTVRYRAWGVIAAALGVTLGAGLLRDNGFLISGLQGLGALHGLVLTKMAYRYMAPKYGIDAYGRDILGSLSNLRNRLFFAGFGALVPVVVITIFILGMERKLNFISSAEYILNITGVIGWGFTATLLFAPVIMYCLPKGNNP